MRRTQFTDDHELFRESVRTFVERRSPRTTSSGSEDGHRPARAVRHRRRRRVPRHGRARGVRRRRGRRLPLQPGGRRGAAVRRRRRAPGSGSRCTTTSASPTSSRSATDEQKARWLPGHRVRRAHHRDRDDRAGHRLRPRVDEHHGHPRRRPLRGERRQDVHHQRHQRRPRDHRGQDRPGAATRGHEPARDRARDGRVRAGPQPREGRPARAGHRRAVLHRRPGAGRRTCSASRARGSRTSSTTCRRSGCRSRWPASPPPRPRSAGRSTT